MIKLQSYQTTIVLPNPEWNDSESLTDEIQTKRSLDGDLFTYIKTKNLRRKLLFTIRLHRMKALELRAFIQSYYRSEIILTDHINRIWIGYLTGNPFVFSTPGATNQTIQLEFEGTLQ